MYFGEAENVMNERSDNEAVRKRQRREIRLLGGWSTAANFAEHGAFGYPQSDLKLHDMTGSL